MELRGSVSDEVWRSCQLKMSYMQIELDQQRQRAEAGEKALAEQKKYVWDMYTVDEILVHCNDISCYCTAPMIKKTCDYPIQGSFGG